MFGNTKPTAATARTWTTCNPSQTISSGTKYVGLGWRDATFVTNLYFDNVKVYVKPDNAFWLASDSTGADRVLTPISDATYTLPLSLNDETVTAWTDGTTV